MLYVGWYRPALPNFGEIAPKMKAQLESSVKAKIRPERRARPAPNSSSRLLKRSISRLSGLAVIMKSHLS